jgi:hypothetical protein
MGRMRIGGPVPAPLGLPHLVAEDAGGREDGVGVEMEGGEIQVGGVLDGHGTERAIV